MGEIRADLISDRLGTGPATLTKQWAAKAWVNFNGSGTVAIRGSENTSSITDNGTGDYTQNLAASMADANYNWAMSGTAVSAAGIAMAARADLAVPAVSTLRMSTFNASFTAVDGTYANCAIHGDLA